MRQFPSSPFRYEETDDVGLVTFDLPDSRVNIFSHAVMEELEQLVSELERKTHLRGLIFASGKPGQFVAGADLNELAAADMTHERAIELARRGQELFSRISRLPFPTVAAIDGPAMGGGLEYVLAMDQRIVSSNPRTELALPEVKIGIIPGWGGTQRLPRFIGVDNAIEMICSGEGVGPERAVELGLAFDAVPAESLLDKARQLIDLMNQTEPSGWRALTGRGEGPPRPSQAQGVPPVADSAAIDWRARRQRMAQPIALSEDQMRRTFAAAEAQIRAKTKGHYPAPLAALKAIREGCHRTLEEGLAIERELIAELLGSPVSRNLIAVFFMTRRLEKDPGVTNTSIRPSEIQRVGVIGAGLMGSGIAAAHARCGFPVIMIDVSDQALADGIQRVRKVVENRIRIGRATPDDLAGMLARLTPSTSLQTLRDCDLLIEAVTEDKDLKMQIYQQLAEILPSGCIVASNTSTISITEMSAAAPAPDRFVGMHFFNPVDRMSLVEVVRGRETSEETLATIVAQAKRIGKKPIVVRDCPGFLINRLLLPYMNEALLMLEEGWDPQTIDKAATDFGMPMGPITLFDLVGLDTALYASQVVAAAYPERAKLSCILNELVTAGRLGQKSGAGFYRYPKGSTRPDPDPELERFLEASRFSRASRGREPSGTPGPNEITDRLFLPMLVEASLCLSEGIVREPADVDMGLILGIGFPAFRGGILRWADSEGIANIVDRLKRYKPLGARFRPTEPLLAMARENRKFFGE